MVLCNILQLFICIWYWNCVEMCVLALFVCVIVYAAVIVIRSMCQFVGRETSYKYVIPVFIFVIFMSHVMSHCAFEYCVTSHAIQDYLASMFPFYWNYSSSYYWMSAL